MHNGWWSLISLYSYISKELQAKQNLRIFWFKKNFCTDRTKKIDCFEKTFWYYIKLRKFSSNCENILRYASESCSVQTKALLATITYLPCYLNVSLSIQGSLSHCHSAQGSLSVLGMSFNQVSTTFLFMAFQPNNVWLNLFTWLSDDTSSCTFLGLWWKQRTCGTITKEKIKY